VQAWWEEVGGIGANVVGEEGGGGRVIGSWCSHGSRQRACVVVMVGNKEGTVPLVGNEDGAGLLALMVGYLLVTRVGWLALLLLLLLLMMLLLLLRILYECAVGCI